MKGNENEILNSVLSSISEAVTGKGKEAKQGKSGIVVLLDSYCDCKKAIENMKSLYATCPDLSVKMELEKRTRYLEMLISIVDNAAADLSEDERIVIDAFYLSPPKHTYGSYDLAPLDKALESIPCEKSTIYRIKSRAVKRMERAMFGVLI